MYVLLDYYILLLINSIEIKKNNEYIFYLSVNKRKKIIVRFRKLTGNSRNICD